MAALWILLLLGVVAADRRYLFTTPKISVAGATEKMCLTLFDVPATGKLKVELSSSSGNRNTVFTQLVNGVVGGAKQTCFEVKMPSDKHAVSDLHLSVTFPNEMNYTIEDRGALTLRDHTDGVPGQHVFVQTDKFVYKPGQLVQFRVLSVDSNLRPISAPIPLIYIETPLGTRVAQWIDEVGQQGLLQLELQLAEEPSLGDWTINVQQAAAADQSAPEDEHKTVFKVKEYVLPKFEVELKGPPFIFADAAEVAFEVCGKYTYGKPVAGNATLRVPQHSSSYETDPQGRWKRPLVSRHRLTGDAACAEFRLSAESLWLGSGRHVSQLEVRAELTEAGTDITYETTKIFKLEYKKRKLVVEDRDKKYFKPGLPFVDQIRVLYPDDSPAAGETVKICLLKRISMKERPTKCESVTSDENGAVNFYVQPQSQHVQHFNIRATVTPIETMTQRYLHLSNIFNLQYDIEGWHSNSGAFLQLLKMDGVKFTCGASAAIPVLFTGPLGFRLELFYQVMSRGDLEPAVSVPVIFDEVADLSVLAGLKGATAIGTPPVDARPTGMVTLSVPVTTSMSTGFKVLVYMVLDGEVIADSAQYEATACLENSVSLRWSPDRAQPKQTTQLTISAAPGSLCGIDVVDKSVHLLGAANKLSLSELFERIKKLNLEAYAGHSQVDAEDYCTAKNGSPEDNFNGESFSRKKRSPWRRSSHGPWERDFQRGYEVVEYYWTTTRVDSLNAFERYSVLLLSDLDTETRPCVVKTRRSFRHNYYDFGLFNNYPDYFSSNNFGGMAMAMSAMEPIQPRSSRFRFGAPRYAASAGPSPPRAPEPVSPEPATAPEEPEEADIAVRTYFPETWLFDLHTVSEDGTVTLKKEVPDSITEWVAGAVCTSETAGLGISAPASLTSFQLFFVSYTLPYSVKRGETLVLKVSVRNYYQHDLPVKLTLVASEQFDTLTPPVMTSCVPSGATEVVTFKLRPGALGDVNITTTAEVYPHYPSQCGPRRIPYFSDAVTRPVLVEPEGFEREIVNSSFICSTGENSELGGAGPDQYISWPLTLPADLVPGSERAHVDVSGDLLGPSIDNLDSLVRQPTGCGEQNMVLFVPNIHVMKYLISVGELTATLKEKLIEHMKTGYQKELKYRHADKSYSAFGNSGSSSPGSMWLTAFVVKSFGDAKNIIFIDEADLVASVRWIESKQTQDGCFPTIGMMLNKAMKGGVSSGGQQALTAFVTVALLRSSVTLKNDTLSGAFQCLHQDSDVDLYTLSLRTYARALAGHTAEASAGLAQLKDRATRSGNMMFWQNSASEKNAALSVEMGAYNVLTMSLLSQTGDAQHFGDSLAAVRWISEQRNSRGGFVSTQDTVLALEALAVFSAALPRTSLSNLRLHISDQGDLDDYVSVTASNRLLMQTHQVSRLPGRLEVQASGTGCALVQTVLKYNVQETDPSDALSITVVSKPKPSQSECLQHIIETCVSYRKPGETNMVLVEVEMVSGFIPDKGSLESLKTDTELDVRRWEVSKNKVVFYFDSLDSRQRCLQMVVQREQEVEDAKPATASVYDYYEAEVALSTSYMHDMECSTTRIWLT